MNGEADIGMPRAERRRDHGHHGERRGDCRDADMAGKAFPQRVDLLAHGAGVADDAPRPVEHALAFRREALEARTPLHEQHTERILELLDAGRERRLTDAAGFGGVAEMPLARQRNDEFELLNHVAMPHTARIISCPVNADRAGMLNGLVVLFLLLGAEILMAGFARFADFLERGLPILART